MPISFSILFRFQFQFLLTEFGGQAVTGAPSTPNLSFEEFTLSNSFGFDDKLRDYWLNIKCVREVLAKEASPQVKTLWAEYKDKLVKLHETEWTKCKGISNIAEQQK